MRFFTKILFCILLSLLVFGCASNLRSHAIGFVDDYSDYVAKHVKSRKAQLELLLGLLNNDLLENKYDPVKSEDINKKIDRLHDEQHFLYTLNLEKFSLEYEIIAETKVSEDIREIIVKVRGKTIKLDKNDDGEITLVFSDKNNRSEIVEIPEEASLWLFKEIKVGSIRQIVGPQPYIEKNPSKPVP